MKEVGDPDRVGPGKYLFTFTHRVLPVPNRSYRTWGQDTDSKPRARGPTGAARDESPSGPVLVSAASVYVRNSLRLGGPTWYFGIDPYIFDGRSDGPRRHPRSLRDCPGVPPLLGPVLPWCRRAPGPVDRGPLFSTESLRRPPGEFFVVGQRESKTPHPMDRSTSH